MGCYAGKRFDSTNANVPIVRLFKGWGGMALGGAGLC